MSPRSNEAICRITEASEVRAISGSVNAGRLWAGGVATAVVAALVVVAGVFIARGILGIPVLAPAAAGSLGSATTVV